jgi:hypothetical protein
MKNNIFEKKIFRTVPAYGNKVDDKLRTDHNNSVVRC